jgi:hypothetical protein
LRSNAADELRVNPVTNVKNGESRLPKCHLLGYIPARKPDRRPLGALAVKVFGGGVIPKKSLEAADEAIVLATPRFLVSVCSSSV